MVVIGWPVSALHVGFSTQNHVNFQNATHPSILTRVVQECSSSLGTINFTIKLHDGTTNYGDYNLICTPATWRDMFVFFVTNYFIYAATLPLVPGAS